MDIDFYESQRKNLIRINKNMKTIVSHSPELFLLSYDVSLQMEIIEDLLRYNPCFYILKVIHEVDLKCTGYYVKLDCTNCHDKIDDIFRQKCTSDYGVIGRLEPKKSYIFLVTIPKLTTNPIVERYSYELYVYLFRQLKTFRFCNYFFYNSAIMMVLSNFSDSERKLIPVKKNRRFLIYENKKEIKNEKVIINPLGGIGDYCMIHSLLSRFISDAKSRNVDVYFMLYANNAVNFPIDIFLPHAKKLYTHNINTSDLVAMCDEVIDLQDIFSSDNRNIRETVFDYTKRRLNICSNIMPYQDKYNVLENVMAYRAISPYAEEFEYIDCLMQGTDYIGFQYYTGYYDERIKEWVSHAPDRCWSVDKVKAFLKLCRNNNIHILLLNRNPYDEQLDAVQLKNVSLPAYFYAISKLKMNVGIDSSAGHIAALLDIPTITLWGRSNPLINHSTEVSFRVLKKNYSIYSRRRNIDYIEPELVLSKILKWQQGELTFEEKIISYKDSLENYMIDIVD